MTGSHSDNLDVNAVGNLGEVASGIAGGPVSSAGNTGTDQSQAVQTTEIKGGKDLTVLLSIIGSVVIIAIAAVVVIIVKSKKKAA